MNIGNIFFIFSFFFIVESDALALKGSNNNNNAFVQHLHTEKQSFTYDMVIDNCNQVVGIIL